MYGKIAQREVFGKTVLYHNHRELERLRLAHWKYKVKEQVDFFGGSSGVIVLEARRNILTLSQLFSTKGSVAVGAAITAEARCVLFNCIAGIIKIEGFERLIYTDTDSLFICARKNPTGFPLFTHPNFTLVWDSSDTFSWAAFLATKLYLAIGDGMTKNKYAHKGVKIKYSDRFLNELMVKKFTLDITLPA